MKRSILGLLVVALVLVLSGCPDDGTPAEVSDATSDYQVRRLFVTDGCTVYRFYDGRSRYFVTCAGGTSTSHSEKCGKSQCMHDVEIPTVRR